MVRVHIFVSGLVQGVFYRQTTMEVAKNLKLTGWVKNLYDGRVEIIAEGEPENIEKLISWCHKGPTHSRVENVEAQYQEYSGEFGSFSVSGW
jgi:acylphosphatase